MQKLLGWLFVCLAACAHDGMQNEVVMKIDERRAHACLNVGEVTVGDRVVLYTEHCDVGAVAAGVLSGGEGECQLTKLGEGTVVEILNEHYSTVEVDEGVEFTEGAKIKRKSVYEAVGFTDSER